MLFLLVVDLLVSRVMFRVTCSVDLLDKSCRCPLQLLAEELIKEEQEG